MPTIIFDNAKERSLIRNIIIEKDLNNLQKLSEKSFVFYKQTNRELFENIVEYVQKYYKVPTEDELYELLDTDLADALSETINTVNDFQTEFLIDELIRLYSIRALRESTDNTESQLLSKSPDVIINDRLVELQELLNVSTKNAVVRKEVWEGAKALWNEYQDVEASDSNLKGLSWNISLLDKITGGCLGGKDHQMILFYGLPGTGKSTMAAINLPYNICIGHDEPVLIISKEMPFNKLCAIFSARMGMLNSELIRDAGLSSKQKKRYKQVLQRQLQRKDKLYVTDLVSARLTLGLVYTELELFKRKYGKYPVYTVIDSLDTLYSGDSKIDAADHTRKQYCSEKLFDRAKQDNLTIVVTDQESRTGAIAKSKGQSRGQEAVKGSHGIMPNVTDAFLLDTPEGEEFMSKINLYCVKSRYGNMKDGSLFFLKEYAYMGEKLLE